MIVVLVVGVSVFFFVVLISAVLLTVFGVSVTLFLVSTFFTVVRSDFLVVVFVVTVTVGGFVDLDISQIIL